MSCYHKLETLNEPPFRYRCTLCGAKLKIASGYYPPKLVYSGDLISGLTATVARAERKHPLYGSAYPRVEEGEPAFDLITELKKAGREVCDSADHNSPEGCSNSACWKHDEMERGRR